jgi:hypothetical protein
MCFEFLEDKMYREFQEEEDKYIPGNKDIFKKRKEQIKGFSQEEFDNIDLSIFNKK